MYSILRTYHSRYSKGGQRLLELIYKFRELERYFLSCRRLISLGRCGDHFYSSLRSMHIHDPVTRTSLTASKLWQSIQMFADHLLWFQSMGLIELDSKLWTDRSSKFWLYSVSASLVRDFYELICIVQERRSIDNLDSQVVKLSLSTPLKWAMKYRKLSCDLFKNMTDFLIPYAAVNDIKLNPSLVALLGIISTTLGILQVYDEQYRLSPS